MKTLLIVILALVAISVSSFVQAQEAQKKPPSPAQRVLMLDRQIGIARHLEAQKPQQPQNLRTAARLAIAAATQAEALDAELAAMQPSTPQIEGLREMAKGVWIQALQTALGFLLKEKKALAPLSETERLLEEAAATDSFVLACFVQLLDLEAQVREIRVNAAAAGKEAEAQPLVEARERQAAALRAKLAARQQEEKK